MQMLGLLIAAVLLLPHAVPAAQPLPVTVYLSPT